MTRRITKLAALHLLLGVVTTVGVALWFWRTEYPPRWPLGKYGWPELRYGYNTTEDIRVVCVGDIGSDAVRIQIGPFHPNHHTGNWPLPPTPNAIPDWVMEVARGENTGYRGFAMVYGLPWRSLAASPSTDEAAVYPDSPRPFPIKPLWSGFIANTIFYALLFTGLHQLVAWGRRARRRRRGRCVKCDYDLTGIDGVCPECGC